MEAIIERMDEFCSENLAQEVVRETREAASRGFVLSSKHVYGCFRQSARRRQGAVGPGG